MARRAKKIGDKTIAKRRQFWPELREDELFNRKIHDGFTTVPRTMPLIMSIIDDLTKGQPAGRCYFELWMRAYDEMYVPINNKEAHAFHCGYSGQRAVQTWLKKIYLLEDLGFIKTASGATGISHAVIINPHIVLKRLYNSGTSGIQKSRYDAIIEHSIEFSMKGVDVDPRDNDIDMSGLEEELNKVVFPIPPLPPISS